jgi:transaldolase / glucose-6-phosphate isomerase
VTESKENTDRVLSSLPLGDVEPVDPSGVTSWLADQVRPGDYVSIQAFLPYDQQPDLPALRDRVRRALGDTAVTAGFGPRFLHSTGQLHKGGPDRCRFLQLVDRPVHQVPVPETDYDFGTLIRAQANGDRQALEQRGRRVLRLQLGPDAHLGLKRLREALGVGPTYEGDGDETLPPEVDPRGRR